MMMAARATPSTNRGQNFKETSSANKTLEIPDGLVGKRKSCQAVKVKTIPFSAAKLAISGHSSAEP